MVVASPSDISDDGAPRLPFGAPSIIQGLVAQHELNGEQVLVEGFDREKDCYIVQRPDESLLLVRRKNLLHWNEASTRHARQLEADSRDGDVVAAALSDLAAGTRASERWTHDVTAKPLDGTLPEKMAVTVTGLVKATSLNGRSGTVISSRIENRHIVQIEGRREPISLKAENLLVRRVARVVIFLASHIDTPARVEAQRQCLRSIHAQTTTAALHLSWSASSAALADAMDAMLTEEMRAEALSLCMRHETRLSQFEHFAALKERMDEHAQAAIGNAALLTTWILFSDDDDVWHTK